VQEKNDCDRLREFCSPFEFLFLQSDDFNGTGGVLNDTPRDITQDETFQSS